MKFHIDIIRASSVQDIRQGLFGVLARYQNLLPVSKSAKILLKPNFNSNMNALAGNTTDLRLIAAVIEFLKDGGYKEITIADGTNSGFYRNNISVISRLAVNKLVDYYGVKGADLNYSEKVDINFEDGVSAGVAKDCIDADFLINMPKLKTHFEVGMSVCLKNLMGCLVGQENKKKTHKNLARNILNINKYVKPHLHIVDALIAMEGLGPSRGNPVNTGLVIVGTNPYLLDLICARIAGFDHRKISTLKSAEEQNIITEDFHQFVDSLDLSNISREFQEPKANPLVSFVHSPKGQKYFLAIRNTAVFNYLCSTRLFGDILFRTGLRQDNFIKEEMVFEGLKFNQSRCKSGCTKCRGYCPTGIKLPENFGHQNNSCIECLYCFSVCPTKAIEIQGKLGFMAEQLRQYDDIIRKVT
ncbi:DUF362 domain-containing protein [Planctomycetota bacterium]